MIVVLECNYRFEEELWSSLVNDYQWGLLCLKSVMFLRSSRLLGIRSVVYLCSHFLLLSSKKSYYHFAYFR